MRRKASPQTIRIRRIVDGGHLRGLSRSALAILFILCRAQGRDGGSFYSLDKFEEQTGLSRSSVIRGLKELADAKLIRDEGTPCGRGKVPTRTLLMVDKKGVTPDTLFDMKRVSSVEPFSPKRVSRLTQKGVKTSAHLIRMKEQGRNKRRNKLILAALVVRRTRKPRRMAPVFPIQANRPPKHTTR